jgi:hypothetical protein
MNTGAGLGNVLIFALGFLMAGLIGRALTKLRAGRAMMQGPNRPMSVQTSTTPADVYRKAAQGRRQTCLMTVLLILLVLLTCFLVSQLGMGCSLLQ